MTFASSSGGGAIFFFLDALSCNTCRDAVCCKHAVIRIHNCAFNYRNPFFAKNESPQMLAVAVL